MALDRALLDLARSGTTFLRLYRWHPACLSFGRHEPALRRYDRQRIAKLGLDTVRRPTGGRAVWHATELTYAFAAPADPLGPLGEAYRIIHGVIADALRYLGADASLAPDDRRVSALDAGACFAAPVGGEVMVGAAKVVGSAQLRHEGELLQHGSVLLSGNQEMVGAVSRGAAVQGVDAGLDVVLGREVAFDEAAEAVSDAAGRWRPGWRRETAPEGFLRAAAPYEDLFRSDEWTWRR
jgi:lipoate-protein ligase A